MRSPIVLCPKKMVVFHTGFAGYYAFFPRKNPEAPGVLLWSHTYDRAKRGKKWDLVTPSWGVRATIDREFKSGAWTLVPEQSREMAERNAMAALRKLVNSGAIV